MRSFLLYTLAALSLISFSQAQHCAVNGQYACDTSNSNLYTICNNNQLVHVSCGAGFVCCTVNGSMKCMTECPSDKPAHSKTKKSSQKKGKSNKTKSSKAKSFTVKNAQGTLYGPALNSNACGISGANPAVAVNPTWFGNGNPNKAAICGKTIVIKNTKTGKTMNARVVDKCGACQADNHLDMTSGLFYGIGGTDASGHAYNLEYTIEGWSP